MYQQEHLSANAQLCRKKINVQSMQCYAVELKELG